MKTLLDFQTKVLYLGLLVKVTSRKITATLLKSTEHFAELIKMVCKQSGMQMQIIPLPRYKYKANEACTFKHDQINLTHHCHKNFIHSWNNFNFMQSLLNHNISPFFAHHKVVIWQSYQKRICFCIPFWLSFLLITFT